MRIQTIIHRFLLVGITISSILLPLVRLENAIATTDTYKDKKLLARGGRQRSEKPGGDFTNWDGNIILPENSIVTKKPGLNQDFTVRFTDKIDFRVEVWDPSIGRNNGGGIESVTFEISDESGNSVHKETIKTIKMRDLYCPFGVGGDPRPGQGRCNSGLLANNHLYSVNITVQPKNASKGGAFWFFKIQT
jgi:hypothetical protein